MIENLNIWCEFENWIQFYEKNVFKSVKWMVLLAVLLLQQMIGCLKWKREYLLVINLLHIKKKKNPKSLSFLKFEKIEK
jgi:hypothetical protein